MGIGLLNGKPQRFFGFPRFFDHIVQGSSSDPATPVFGQKGDIENSPFVRPGGKPQMAHRIAIYQDQKPLGIWILCFIELSLRLKLHVQQGSELSSRHGQELKLPPMCTCIEFEQKRIVRGFGRAE